MAVTATCTDVTRTDLEAQLSLKQPKLLLGSCNRHNISYRVKLKDAVAQSRLDLDGKGISEGVVRVCTFRA